MDALVQECQFTHPVSQGIIVIDSGSREDFRIRVESHYSTGIVALAHYIDRSERLSLGILLAENLALSVNLGHEFVGQCIDAGYADSVKTSGNLVAVLVELTSGMKHRENDLESRPVLLRVHIGRDSSSIVLDTYGIILGYRHLDMVAEAGHRLVNTIVNHLIYKMMQSSHTYISNVH